MIIIMTVTMTVILTVTPMVVGCLCLFAVKRRALDSKERRDVRLRQCRGEVASLKSQLAVARLELDRKQAWIDGEKSRMLGLRSLHFQQHAVIVKSQLRRTLCSPSVLTEIRAVCRLSYTKLAYIGHRLFCAYEEPEEAWLVGRWQPHKIGDTDVRFPKLATRSLITKCQAPLSEYHRRVVDEETGASQLDFPCLFERALSNVEWPLFTSVIQQTGVVEFNLMLDAHGCLKGTNLTEITGRLVQFLRFSSSPYGLFHIAVVPGKDDYDSIAPVLAPIRAFIMKIKYDQKGKFTFNHPGSSTPVTVDVQFTFAGGLVAGREVLGLTVPFSASHEICSWSRASIRTRFINHHGPPSPLMAVSCSTAPFRCAMLRGCVT